MAKGQEMHNVVYTKESGNIEDRSMVLKQQDPNAGKEEMLL